jgi:RHS repeat-associated protein
LTYDNNGNLQTITDSSGTTTYTWNARNQLVGISGPSVNASFLYDGLGRREKKTINGNLTEFLFDGVNPVQETSGAAIVANILPGRGVDEFLTRTDMGVGTTSHILPDALGSTVALAEAAGIVQTEYTYEPFGRTTTTGASNTSSYQYTGRENDGTGLYYYRARYYHPQLQRFASEDPYLHPSYHGCPSAAVALRSGSLLAAVVKDPQILNVYGYAGNNPIKFRDPLGLDKEPPCNDKPFLDCWVECYTERIPIWGDVACAIALYLCISSGGANVPACVVGAACGAHQAITAVICVQQCRTIPRCE